MILTFAETTRHRRFPPAHCRGKLEESPNTQTRPGVAQALHLLVSDGSSGAPLSPTTPNDSEQPASREVPIEIITLGKPSHTFIAPPRPHSKSIIDHLGPLMKTERFANNVVGAYLGFQYQVMEHKPSQAIFCVVDCCRSFCLDPSFSCRLIGD